MKNVSRKSSFQYVSALVMTSALIACGSAEGPSSEVKVTNGREIAESEYPSVVLLVMQSPEGQGICTGTFVNETQVVSAGHCVEGLNQSSPELFYVTQVKQNGKLVYKQIAKAVSYARNPKYDISMGVNANDLSVITFPAKTAPAVSKIARTAPRKGDVLTIVGYGNNINSIDASGHMTGSGAGSKRAGRNKVDAVTKGFIDFEGLPKADGTTGEGVEASSGAGDSGGPLFINDQLAGITSGGGLMKGPDGTLVAVSKYVDLNSKTSRDHLARSLN